MRNTAVALADRIHLLKNAAQRVAIVLPRCAIDLIVLDNSIDGKLVSQEVT